MIRTFKPRMDVLPPAQKRLWPELHGVQKIGFVLYGGTAVSLRLGHRVSVDFDFFSDKPLDRNALYRDIPFLKTAMVLQDQPQTATWRISSGTPDENDVKLSFFGEIGFGRLGDPEITEDGVLQVASMDDLLATKLKVILQRIEAKDYRDIAVMIAAGISLSKGLAGARRMYGMQFQPMESLKAMVYFEGGDLYMLKPEEKEILIHAAGKVHDLPAVEIVSRCLTL